MSISRAKLNTALIFFFPLLVSFVLISVDDLVFGGNYCEFSHSSLSKFGFAGLGQLPRGLTSCVLEGALSSFIYTVPIYILIINVFMPSRGCRELAKILSVRLSLSPVFIVTLLATWVFYDDMELSTRGGKFLELVRSGPIMFYIFMFVPLTLSVFLWAGWLKYMYFKLRG